MGYIYSIKNSSNNKLYVGLTIQTLEKRFASHKGTAFRGDTLLHRAMLKYGIDNFSIDLIEEVADGQLSEREKFWIAKLDTLKPNGYNINPGGAGVLRHSIETKQKISNTLKGRNLLSSESRARARVKMLGRTVSEETRAKLSIKASERTGNKNPFFGKTHTDETKRRIAEKATGRPSSKRIRVEGLIDNEWISFPSMSAAYDYLNQIGRVKGKRPNVINGIRRAIDHDTTAYGCKWKFI